MTDNHIPLTESGKGSAPRRKQDQEKYRSNSFWDNTSFAQKQREKND